MFFWLQFKNYIYWWLIFISIVIIASVILFSTKLQDSISVSSDNKVIFVNNDLNDYYSYNIYPEDIKINCSEWKICDLLKSDINSFKKTLIFKITWKKGNKDISNKELKPLYWDIKSIVSWIVLSNWNNIIEVDTKDNNSWEEKYWQNYYTCIENIKLDLLDWEFDYEKKLSERIESECSSYKTEPNIDESIKVITQKDFNENIEIVISKLKIDYKWYNLLNWDYVDADNKTFYKDIELNYSWKVNSSDILNN